ncbi:calcium-binding protein [Kordiimonas laminariae]|uniref:calcium-binding protein n=1 Tax=Kordiimonas laminariae TaxID=2917717 RepID=UPI001FF54F20|nr:hypothetical protein [Kordiimonas laminariae]MCK0068440.1 hypothetical protein [Kordiimonas laminariae]
MNFDTDDTLIGSGNRDTLEGFNGDDVIVGGTAYDRLIGGDGNDFLIGSLHTDVIVEGQTVIHADFMVGGEGDDTLVGGSFYTSPLSLGNGAPAEASPNFGSGALLKSNIAKIHSMWAGDGNDLILSGHDDIIGTGAGNDTIRSVSGDDTIYAGTGDDHIIRYLDSAVIYGGDGNDSIVAGYNSDTVWGGAGDDTINGAVDQQAEFEQDTFYFASNHGNDVLLVGGDADSFILNFENFSGGVSSASQLRATAETVSSDHHYYSFGLKLTTDDGDSITILSHEVITASDLNIVF